MASIIKKKPQKEQAVPIIAQASAKGVSAIAVIRISGSDLAGWLLPRLAWKLEPRRSSLRTLKAPDGIAIDQVLATFFPAPHSFTGEDLLEIHSHGSPAIIAWVMESFLVFGKEQQLRLAKPGEFSERAFLNDRLDLAQAEAIADLIAASTRLQAKAALRSLKGEFSQQVKAYIDAVQDLRMLVEAALDFPEEPVESLADWGLDASLDALIETMQTQLPGWKQGAQLQTGLSLALIGPPNAGKSSLLNAFAGEELALVDAEPGTTRDRITQSFQWQGQLIEMTDTAGIREAALAGRIEQKGMQRSWESASRAQAVLLVISVEDALLQAGGPAAVLEPQTLEAMARAFAHQWWHRHLDESHADTVQAPTVVVLNKLDLLDAALQQRWLAGDRSASIADQDAKTSVIDWPVIPVSARERIGLERLMDALLEKLQVQGESTEPTWARLRHVTALEQTINHLKSARAHWTSANGQADLMAEELRLAQRSLAEITGIWSDEDLLGAIFSRFCIGK